jgi:isocitrate lyase
MTQYQDDIKAVAGLKEQQGSAWNAISPESAARMRAQNKFKTGLDIARYTARIMRADMAAYDADSSKYTQSLGCWHGFIGQQKMISIKKHFNSTDRRYLYLSGWMVAALRSEFGPLPDQSMHEKTSVSALIRELYTFLRQADARELGGLFRQLDAAEGAAKAAIQEKIDNHVTHVVPIIADIDAGFGNAEATYLLAKQLRAAFRSKTRCPTRSSAATRMAKSPCLTRTSSPRSAPSAMPSWNWVWTTASSWPVPTRWAPA